MIVPSQRLKDYIGGFESKEEFCKLFDISSDTLFLYMNGKQQCSSNFIGKVKEITQWDFEKAFEIVSDGKD